MTHQPGRADQPRPAALSHIMKFFLYIDGRRHSAGTIAPGEIETIAAPEGATLRTHDGTRAAWHWRTGDQWHRMNPDDQRSPAATLAAMQTATTPTR